MYSCFSTTAPLLLQLLSHQTHRRNCLTPPCLLFSCHIPPTVLYTPRSLLLAVLPFLSLPRGAPVHESLKIIDGEFKHGKPRFNGDDLLKPRYNLSPRVPWSPFPPSLLPSFRLPSPSPPSSLLVSPSPTPPGSGIVPQPLELSDLSRERRYALAMVPHLGIV